MFLRVPKGYFGLKEVKRVYKSLQGGKRGYRPLKRVASG